MKVAKLISTTGEVIVEVRVPDSMQEVRLEQYVNFLKAMEPVQEGHPNYIPNVVQAISEFYGVDMNTLLTVRFKGKEPQLLDSLAPLYWHTHKLISDYNPTLRKGGDLTRSAEALRSAVEIEPGNPEWRVSLAEVLAESGKIDDAVAELGVVNELVTLGARLGRDTQARLDRMRQKR